MIGKGFHTQTMNIRQQAKKIEPQLFATNKQSDCRWFKLSQDLNKLIGYR